MNRANLNSNRNYAFLHLASRLIFYGRRERKKTRHKFDSVFSKLKDLICYNNKLSFIVFVFLYREHCTILQCNNNNKFSWNAKVLNEGKIHRFHGFELHFSLTVASFVIVFPSQKPYNMHTHKQICATATPISIPITWGFALESKGAYCEMKVRFNMILENCMAHNKKNIICEETDASTHRSALSSHKLYNLLHTFGVLLFSYIHLLSVYVRKINIKCALHSTN